MANLFTHVTFVGFGLIASSMARAMRERGLCQRISVVDNNPTVLEKAVALGLADTATADVAAGVREADIVILATPVRCFAAIAAAMRDSVAEGCIVSDVGSVKARVISDVQRHLPSHVAFVPAHPIAGTEHSGIDAGFSQLFEGRWCILTPIDDSPAVAKVQALWEALGSNVALMDAAHHDKVLAITSHLPHLIAYTIVGTTVDLETTLQSEVLKFSAGGFRDFTRIAASDPVMWRDIFLTNKDAVLEMLGRFTEDLAALQKAIRWEDGQALEDLFTRTRAIRRGIIAEKQDN